MPIEVEDAVADSVMIKELTKVLTDGNATLVRAFGRLTDELDRAETIEDMDYILDIITKLANLGFTTAGAKG